MLVRLLNARIEIKQKPQNQYRTLKIINGWLDFTLRRELQNSRFRGKSLSAEEGKEFNKLLCYLVNC